jgi:hypothetical protein
MTRVIVLITVILFFSGFALLTIAAISEQGLGLGGVISICILVLLAVGIVGSLRNPPPY